MLAIFGGCVFLAAGSWAWARGWAALTVCLIAEAIVNSILAIYAPNTVNQRGTSHEGVKAFDTVFATLYVILSVCLAVVIGFDCVRLQWSPLPWQTFVIGLCPLVAATVIGTWAMLENDHFEQFVRIQSDRNHRVITTGPYKVVRHPGYLAAILGAIAGPLLFGSTWASFPAGLMILLLVWRTNSEDLTLRNELEGYSEYTTQTPNRLIPGVW